MTALDPFRAWEVIQRLLPQDFRELAKEHKQVQTQFGNAKITSAEELLRFIFAHVLSEGPLRHTVAAMEAAGGPRLSAMRLHMKLRQAAPYLHTLLQRLVPEREAFDLAAFGGFELVALDGADVVGPGSTCAPARVHVAMKLDDLRITAVNVADATERDGLRRFFWTPGQVVVASAAETSSASIERVRAQGADVLLYGADESLTAGGAAGPARFLVGPDTEPARGGEITGSYPVITSPSWVEPESRRMARRPTLFTTLPEFAFPAETLFDIHALAMRVLDKTSGWKASQHVARLSNQREDTTLSWLYAKMILGILQHRLDGTEPGSHALAS